MTKLCLLVAVLQTSLSSYTNKEVSVNQKSVDEIVLTINIENSPLTETLDEITRQTDLMFAMDGRLIDDKQSVSLKAEDETLGNVLRQMAKDLEIKFKRIDETIHISPHERLSESGELVEEIINQQTVSGRVIDQESGEGLPGVSIIIKGTSNGTTTDIDGGYTLQLPGEDDVLIFTFIGYESQEVIVGNQSQIDISLSPDFAELEEVVVVGYGVKAKREVTGAIASIGAKDIDQQYVTGFDQALTGRVAGVQVLQSSGAPGGSLSVRVRGVGTPGVSEPLYVIDGIPVFNDNSGKSSIGRGQPNNVLNTINPSDIQSIEVLKDAASAAIYGSRAGNGVVIITTKKGKQGVPKLNIDYSFGIQSLQRQVEMLDGPTYDKFVHELYALDENEFNDGPFTNPANTNWQDEVFRQAGTHNFNASIGGGNEHSTYMLSTGYMNQEGILEGTDFERFSLRLNSNHQINSKLKIGNNFTVSRILTSNTAENNIFNAAIPLALITPSVIPGYMPDGSYGTPASVGMSFQRHNPHILTLANLNKNDMFRFLGNVFAEYEFIEGLKYRVNAGGDFIYGGTTSFSPTLDVPGGVDQTAGAFKFDGKEFIWLLENTLSYNKSLSGGHDVGVLVGATQQKSFATTHGSGRTDFPVNTLHALNAGNTVTNATGEINEWTLASFIGRLDYNYKGKYIVTASIRRDGSSRFGPSVENKWGTFPSISGGWMLSDETFFNVNAISQLKLRASWGSLGNQEIPAFGYLPILENNAQYTFGGSLVPGLYNAQPPNEQIRWESSTQFDIGFDLYMFEDRVTFSFDYYDKETSDILLESTLPLSYGFLNDRSSQFPIINAGVVSNKGLEFDLGFRGGTGDFNWYAAANLSTLNNEVISLGDGGPMVRQTEGYSTRTDVGMAIGSFYGYRMEGIFQNQADIDGHAEQPGARPGDIKFRDLDGNGIIDNADQEVIGSAIPDLTYGISLGGNYQKLDFSIMLQGVSGNEIYSSVMQQAGDFTKPDNKFARLYEERWTGEGTSNTVPAMSISNPNNNYRNSDYFIHDGSFVRLKSLQVGYTVIDGSNNIKGIDRVRLYVGGQNLLTFDNYDFGHDPEVGAVAQDNNFAGVDLGRYPTPRTVTMGINATF
ncbi:MAG: TonB-dependent receptor [Cyclobacteriaceae bacterium]